jgi:5-methylcytosine-specific restriction endonuclease McrA
VARAAGKRGVYKKKAQRKVFERQGRETMQVLKPKIKKLSRYEKFLKYRKDARARQSRKIDQGRPLRALVIARDGRCMFPGCNSRIGLETHHIKPRSTGGKDTEQNLITLCASCHTMKAGAVHPSNVKKYAIIFDLYISKLYNERGVK